MSPAADTRDVPERPGEPPSFDTEVAHSARIYDYWLGGKDNYAADREAAQRVIAANPNILPGVRANRAFLRRAVEYLAGEAGVRQFLDIGTGLPTNENTHEVAQRVAPDARIVYVDNDPIVLAHAHRLLRGSLEGASRYIFGELREPMTILDEAAETLDLGQPVAIMLLGVLHFFRAADDPAGVVRELMSALPPGSYLALSHLACDVAGDAMTETFSRLNSQMAETVVLRTREEVAGLFGRLELVVPGVLQLPQWRPDPDAPAAGALPMWCGVARKTADQF